MPKFDNLGALFAHINKQVNNALETNVEPVVEKTLAEKVRSEVYSAYEPEVYQRRGELGSLANMQSELIEDGVLFTKDVAISNESVLGYPSSSGTEFSRWVADGAVSPKPFGYGPWTESRDFIGAAVDELNASGAAAKALAAGLNGSGIVATVKAGRGG